MIALLYLGHSAFAQLGWGELLAVSCAAIVLYAAIYLTIPTNNVERHYFLELLSGIRARLRTGK